MRSILAVLLVLACATPAVAQTSAASSSAPRLVKPALPQRFVPPETISLSGPRFGFTSLSPGIVEKLAERDIIVQPLISQFGWQFERQLVSSDSGLTAISEWVVLFGGLEQNVPIPSVTWLVGMRTSQGAEFGIGPNITPAGTALAVAAGVTLKVGSMNVPMNFAVVPSSAGVRVSFLTGFNFRRR